MFIKIVLTLFAMVSFAHAEQASDEMLFDIVAFYEGRPYVGAVFRTKNTSCTTNQFGRCLLKVSHDSYFEKIMDGVTRKKFYLIANIADFGSKTTFDFKEGNRVLAIADIKERGVSYEFEYPKISEKPDLNSIEDISGPKFKIKGRVTSSETGQSVSNAQIFAIGIDGEALTTSSGNFELSVRKGVRLSVVHPDYATYTTDPLSLKMNQPLSIVLKPSSIQLKDFVVTAPHIKGSMSALLDERKETKEVADVIGSEQMSKSGDSDAASALGRVTGLTLVDGKYIFIRGLDERYTAILLNDSKLPSPDPAKRVIPLDLIPTEMIESIKIQKSMVPARTGEFGGGVISIRSKSYPSDFKANVNLSVGLKSAGLDGAGFIPILNSENVYTYEGSNNDYTGLDDGTREIPDSVNSASKKKGKITSSNYSEKEIIDYTKSFNNSWDTKNITKGPPVSFKLGIGDKVRFGNKEIGYNTALLYGDKYSRHEKRLFRYVASAGKLDSIDKELKNDISKRSIKFGVLTMVGAKFGKKNELKASSILTRKTSDKVQLKNGSSGSGDDRFNSTKLEWNERKLEFNQLSGQHTIIDNLKLNWFYSASSTQRYLPDTREYTYEVAEDTNNKRLSTRSTGATRSFALLKDSVEDYSVDIKYNFFKSSILKSTLSLGFNKFTKNRQSDTKRYFYTYTDVSSIDLSQNVERIFSESNVANGLVLIDEGTLNTDEYTARQLLDSHYISMDFNLYETIYLNLGKRTEWTNQQVISYDKDAAEKVPLKSEIDNADSLPSANLTYKFSPKYQLRLGWSKTVARPEFRELSTATFFDDTVDMSVEGYPDLKRSMIDNTDIRFEYYPTPNESFSIGYFAKNIENPIEKYYITEGADSQVITFRNSEKAENLGVELDFILKPALFSKAYALTFGGNYSRVFSTTTIDPNKIEGASSVTSLSRPMQGVSPYSVNGFLSFDIYRYATTFTLLINEIGERITEIGTNNVPDIWEEPIRTLDFVASSKFGRNRNWKIGFKAKDFQPTTRKSTQDGKVISSYKSQSDYSLSVGYKF